MAKKGIWKELEHGAEEILESLEHAGENILHDVEDLLGLRHHKHSKHKHHPNRRHHPHKPKADLSKFWVITVISNPVRYKRRYELYWMFKEYCEASGVNLITVEQAFGNRPFMVTRPDDPYNLQVRSHEEIWLKENMINLGVKHACTIAPGGVREVAWIDADCRSVLPARQWFEETWHQLQHYEFVQMWENMLDLDPNNNVIGAPQPSFMSNYIKYGTPNPEEFKKLQEACYPGGSNKIFGRPGLAWAANLSAFNHVGGMIDFCILGAGDWYMAHGLVGSMNVTYASDQASSHYAHALLQWQKRAEHWIKRDVGFVPGTVYHDFHGKKVNRFYGSRGKILTDNKYDPREDIKKDCHGLLQLETIEPRQIKLRDQIRAYFRSRNEDSIDV